jgi:small subunit ribosomal protein S16
MATKIRLQRFGKKGKPFYHLVVADSRAPRDGKFIERIGSYNPNTNPATIDLNFDKALSWVNQGAQPTDTCRAILSYKGVLYKKHLEGGIKKGALTQEQADAKFAAWLTSKDAQIIGKKDSLTQTKEQVKKAALVAEAKRKEDKAAAIEAKYAAPAEVEEVVVEEVPVAEETENTEETTEVAAEETVVSEDAPEAPEVAVEEPASEEAPVAEEITEAIEEALEAEIAVEEPASDEVTETVEDAVAEVAEEVVEEPAAEEAPVAEEVVEEAQAAAETSSEEAPADETPAE